MFKALPENLRDLKPLKFEYPFYYSPSPLALKASEELMQELASKKLSHDFNQIGKMFGVLICEKNGELGYLKAFSGVLQNGERPKDFVPHIYDELDDLVAFEKEKDEINELTSKIAKLEAIDHSHELSRLQTEINKFEEILQSLKVNLKEKKKKRKLKRTMPEYNEEVEKELVKESLADKHDFKLKNQEILNEIDKLKNKINDLTSPILKLKEQRKNQSYQLHYKIFQSYKLLNQAGEKKDLITLFNGELPPAGSGDCALPKLLQYAYKKGLSPISFAEFWWGAPHKSQIRKHKNFYHACTGKCKPILKHMLNGIPMQDNPMLTHPSHQLQFSIIFEDEDLLIINKPSTLLTVPGVDIKDSVYTRIKEKHPEYTGPLIVHRLDQDTSGILIITKNEHAHKEIQKQFINRTIKKRYTALLEGDLAEKRGLIKLPLRADMENRPLQIVCYKHGKEAITDYEVIKKIKDKTLVYFYPHTGRTHQLRVHAAHQDGLNAPIVGDDFYGIKDKRLHLHASQISFTHPRTKEFISFECQDNF